MSSMPSNGSIFHFLLLDLFLSLCIGGPLADSLPLCSAVSRRCPRLVLWFIIRGLCALCRCSPGIHPQPMVRCSSASWPHPSIIDFCVCLVLHQSPRCRLALPTWSVAGWLERDTKLSNTGSPLVLPLLYSAEHTSHPKLRGLRGGCTAVLPIVVASATTSAAMTRWVVNFTFRCKNETYL